LRLLERKNPGSINDHSGRELPTVDEFAEAIARAAVNEGMVSGETLYVGSTEY
jgi:hypothetical protein